MRDYPATVGTPRNHRNCDGCDGRRPLTLADREHIHGRSFRDYDVRSGTVTCARCLDDLPHGPAALWHVCDDEQAQPAPGDTVWYRGQHRDMHGVWEVTVVDDRGRLRLADIDRALSHVSPASVVILHRAGPLTPEPAAAAG
jgi:hypothetical protein